MEFGPKPPGQPEYEIIVRMNAYEITSILTDLRFTNEREGLYDASQKLYDHLASLVKDGEED